MAEGMQNRGRARRDQAKEEVSCCHQVLGHKHIPMAMTLATVPKVPR